MDDSHEVDIQESLPPFERNVLRLAELRDTGVVEKKIDPSRALDEIPDHRLEAIEVAHIK